MKALLIKEIKSQFSAPFIYLVLGMFTLVSGWMFFNFLIGYIENLQNFPSHLRTPLDFYSSVVFKYFGNLNILFLFLVPILTMKSFAGEVENKTMSIYYSAPLSLWSLVFGKFLSLLFTLLVVLSTTAVFPIVLSFIGLSDYTFVLTSYLGITLNLIFYIAIGVLCSSLTQNQLMSGVMGFVVILGFWMISWGLNISTDYFIVENLKFFSVITHFEKILKGIFSFGDIFYYFSFAFVFLFLTKKKLESRLWEGN